ncbi:PAS domain S-box protein [Spirochaetota bacterium]
MEKHNFNVKEHYLASIFNASFQGIVIVNNKSEILEINPAFTKILGYTKKDVKGKPFSIVAPDNLTSDIKDIKNFLHIFHDTENTTKHFTFINKDGREIPVKFISIFIKDEENNIKEAIGIIDQRVEEELIETKDLLESVFRTALDSIIITDEGGYIIKANKKAVSIFGYSEKELLSMHLAELSPQALDYYSANAKYPDVIDELFEVGYIESYETRYQRKDGTIFPADVGITLLKNKSGDVIGGVSFLRDITNRKAAEKNKTRLEAQLIRAEKMETVGTLAGGVAHDLNNILGAIVGYPDLLLDDIPEDNLNLRQAIQAIKESGERAAAIVQDLLTLTRRCITLTEVVNLNTAINDFFNSREYKKMKELHPRIKIDTALEQDLLNIKGSTVHLSKVIMNLISNAIEAMPSYGKIRISTENIYLDSHIKGYDRVEEGDYAVLIVEDSGTGISDEDKDKIFEPFYTKKILGRSGSGLGLSVVWGTVKDHNGYIDLFSDEGKGTTFKLYFPIVRKDTHTKETPLSVNEYSGNNESILVIDDVAAQREIATNLLNRLNYNVDAVASGKEAIEYLKTKKADILILDMIMSPGIDGLETYKEILKINPGQKAIIASGFSETRQVRETQKLGAGFYIKKPYTLEKIGTAVKLELEKNS